MAVVESGGSLVGNGVAWSRPFITTGITLYNGRTQDYAELYRRQPNLRLVTRFLGRNIAQLGLNAYRRVSDTERERLSTKHKLSQFLANPTPSLPRPTSQHAWIDALVQDLALYDRLFVYKARGGGDVLNGVRMPPTTVELTGQNPFWPDGFRLNGRADDVKSNEEMIFLHGFDPSNARDGVSSVESLRQTLAEEASAAEYREQFWRNSARVSGIITRPADAGKWSDTARNRFVSDWRATRTGSGDGAGGTPILEDGMTFATTSYSAKESEYLGARRLSREEVAAAYFIPPVFVGILENANFSNVKEQHRSLYTDTLGPWLNWLTQELELQLVPEFDDVEDVYLEFNIEAKLAGSFEEQAQAMQSAIGAPWMTRNEGRALSNRAPVDGGDELVVPLNVLVGGQASPNDSAPPATGTASRSSKDRPASGAKAQLPAYLRGWDAKHVEVLGRHFERQSASVLSKLGAGQDLDEAFQRDRWDTELKNDLFGLALEMAPDVGDPVAERFGAEFDVARTEAWLSVNAQAAAEHINGATYDELAAAWSGVPRRGELSRGGKASVAQALEEAGLSDFDDEEDDNDDELGEMTLDPARDVFAAAIAVRVPIMSITRVTAIGQWLRKEAAGQAGVRTKTWISSGAANSRHGELDGETVPLGEPFSNGGEYPGDAALGVDETAGCLCSLDFGQEASE